MNESAVFSAAVKLPAAERACGADATLRLTDALWQMKKPDDANRYYRAAVEWLDWPREPQRAANVVTYGFSSIWPVLWTSPKKMEP
jgi:hypothetical protein